MKIYTKIGDDGTTMLFGGGRVPKSHLRINAFGTVEELNSWIGLIRDQVAGSLHQPILKEIQDRLFTVGAKLATNPEKSKAKSPDLLSSDIELLEKEIDRMEELLDPLKHFILPGGHTTVSYCHLARCVCRRTERMIVLLHLEEPVDDILIQYVNRLSDYLFVLSRMLAKELGAEEVIWEARK